MRIRTLFNIILKILGIFFLKDILAMIVQTATMLLYFAQSETIDEGVAGFISNSAILLFYLVVSYYLIFKTELILDRLKLTSGIEDETIDFTIHRSTILSISIIIIGGLIVTDEIPNFCRQLFDYFQEKRMTYGQTHPKISHSILAMSKIIIGLLLMSNQRQIVNFIEHQRKR